LRLIVITLRPVLWAVFVLFKLAKKILPIGRVVDTELEPVQRLEIPASSGCFRDKFVLLTVTNSVCIFAGLTIPDAISTALNILKIDTGRTLDVINVERMPFIKSANVVEQVIVIMAILTTLAGIPYKLNQRKGEGLIGIQFIQSVVKTEMHNIPFKDRHEVRGMGKRELIIEAVMFNQNSRPLHNFLMFFHRLHINDELVSVHFLIFFPKVSEVVSFLYSFIGNLEIVLFLFNAYE
jgi:hypothetical protein